MGITVDYDAAEKRLDEAVRLARSEESLPDKWIEAAADMGDSPNVTFVASLATGLLARATDSRVDALALKKSSGENAYSARGLCHRVLVPPALKHGYDLGATGREPLNNQPFFRYDRVDGFERIRSSAEPHHRRLVGYLSDANELDEDEALKALAAFLRVRIRVAEDVEPIDLSARTGLQKLLKLTDAFITDEIEEGKRAQAFVAATLDLVFRRVNMVRINDPSRRLPGDVQGFHTSRSEPVVAAEVRAKPMSESEVRRFSRSLPDEGVEHGMVVAVAPDQPELPVAELEEEAWDSLGVLLEVFTSASTLLRTALAWSAQPVDDLLEEFPQAMADRLEEIEVERSTVERWAELFAGESAADEAAASADTGEETLEL